MKCSKSLFRFAKLEAYFETGYGKTSYVKYIIVLFGLAEGFATQALSRTFILAFLYGIACFFIGWAWFRFGIITAEHEVQNQFNLFQREMRAKLKNRKI